MFSVHFVSETTKFYKALAMIGLDFTMISQLFPNRSRMDIKVVDPHLSHPYIPLYNKTAKQNIILLCCMFMIFVSLVLFDPMECLAIKLMDKKRTGREE